MSSLVAGEHSETPGGSEPGAVPSSAKGNVRDDSARLYVAEMTVRNFRGLAKCRIAFEPKLTLLVGRNNSGKSRVLRALAIALRAVPADRDDLTVNGPDDSTIDIILAPSEKSQDEDAFEIRTKRRLGADVQSLSDDPLRERFGWRTTIRPSREGFGVRTDSAILIFDQGKQEWDLPANSRAPSSEQSSLLVADLVETRRDLVEELGRRGSVIRRILDDLEIGPDRRAELESGLQELGADIVSASESLAAVTQALSSLTGAIDSIGVPSFRPLPVRLEELARAVSIDLDTGSGELPIRLHGSGARSLSSLQVQSVFYERRMGKDGRALRPHPVSLIEEPEAHLHPQAQFELVELLGKIRGQLIVSTHSTHLLTMADPRSMRILQSTSQGANVVDLCPAETDDAAEFRARKPSLHLQEMEKVRRLVERPFGELLFASAVVLGDGATERAVLPPLLRHVLRQRAHGICVVDPGSMASEHAIAVVKLAQVLGIPWLLFSDSDTEGVKAAERIVEQFGGTGKEPNHVVWVRDEAQDDKGCATEQLFLSFDSALCAAASARLNFSGGSLEALLMFMTKHKGSMGRMLAEELLAQRSDVERILGERGYWPEPIVAVIRILDRVLPSRKGNQP